jgi:hypothetical protein
MLTTTLHELIIDRLHPRAAIAIDDPYELHRAICECMLRPVGDPRPLFLIEPVPVGAKVAKVQVRGTCEIDWNRLEDPGFFASEPISTTTVIDHHPGERVAWRVRINTVRNQNGSRTPRPKEMEDITTGLLIRHAGFSEIDFVEEQPPICIQVYKHAKDKVRRGLTHAIAFGTATIDDPSMLDTVMEKGIGDERHLGCGMLMVKGIRHPSR